MDIQLDVINVPLDVSLGISSDVSLGISSDVINV
jgi:hypothetical protein